MKQSVSFTVNGQPHCVSHGQSWMRLVDYIRDVARLKGTKITCREGGCGDCCVVVTKQTRGEEQESTFVINSCICPVYLADGWAITTVEGLGDRKTGYHPIQTRLAEYNASQCGFCTPGIAMNLYSTLKNCTKPCKSDLEKSLDGHICRCTGYRPILDAAKSFACDADTEADPVDIEDLDKGLCQQMSGQNRGNSPSKLSLKLDDGKTWQRVTSLPELFPIQKQHAENAGLSLVMGHTSVGVFRNAMDSAQVLVDISSIPELHVTKINGGLVLGAGHSLTSLCSIFSETAKDHPEFFYLNELTRMIEKVANKGLRNMGTWAGNLMLQYHHPNFPSDISVILEAAGARLEICDCDNNRNQLQLGQLWNEDMTNCIILNMCLPPMKDNIMFKTYKVTPRSTNNYSLINAAFKVPVDKATLTVQSKPTLIYGCVGGRYVHAEKTQDYLNGKSLKDTTVITEALRLLREEINPPAHPMATSPEYRRDVAITLLYKFFLEVFGDHVPAHLRSGAGLLERPVSCGQQDYHVKDELLGASVPKAGIIQQAAGETRFLADIPHQEGELHGTYVLSSIAKGSIDNIDSSEAVCFPGVVRVLTAKDLAIVKSDSGMVQGHEMVSDGQIEFIHQPVAVVLAESQLAADLAASHVKVTYKDIETPIMDVYKAIEHNSMFPRLFPPHQIGDPKGALEKCDKILEGEVYLGPQDHFYMETQCCLCVPHENTMDMWSSTQAMTPVQTAVSKATGRPLNSIHVTVPAIGGGFGGKLDLSGVLAATVATSAEIMNRPVRMVMSLSDNLKTGAKRIPYLFKYKAGLNSDGQIMALNIDVYIDMGHNPYSAFFWFKCINVMTDPYNIPNLVLTPHFMKTNRRGTAAMRAPVHCATAFFMENLMNRVAREFSRDPFDLRFSHLPQPENHGLRTYDSPLCLPKIWSELCDTSDYHKRKYQIKEFNKENRWKKKGLSVIPAGYKINYRMFNESCFIAVYHGDGSVAVSHGGTEMGQGLNTKVCQAVAMTLGVPLELVHCQPTNSLIGANVFFSAGSITSEICVRAAIEGCKILQDRMAPVRKENPEATWTELVFKSHQALIDLTVQYRCFPPQQANAYSTYGMCVTEAEVDILTGQYQINRVDIRMDLGQSMNPMLDIGQIEGAFLIGMGYMLTEKEIVDPKTGKILSDSTQSYKVPMAQDIPIDFRISLVKDSDNKLGITRSKAVGEPPMCMTPSVLFAIKEAIEASREERGYKPEYLHIDPPLTVEKVQGLAGVKMDQLSVS